MTGHSRTFRLAAVLLAAAAFAPLTSAAAQAGAKKPNIVVIMGDDIGM